MLKIDLQNLIFWFNDRKTLFSYFKGNQIGKGEKRRLFWDNGGSILLVAHIDTVLPPKVNRITNDRIYAQGLDDRLGCAMGFQLMAYMNKKKKLPNVDLLLCDFEESAASTAQYHKIKKSYNFILELDRAGVDFVDYGGLADADFIRDFEDCTGMDWGFGAFSDICFMDGCTIGRINVGIGYYKAHDKKSYAIFDEVNLSLYNIVKFCRNFKDRKYTGLAKSERYTGFYQPYIPNDWAVIDWTCPKCYNVISDYVDAKPHCACGNYMIELENAYRDTSASTDDTGPILLSDDDDVGNYFCNECSHSLNDYATCCDGICNRDLTKGKGKPKPDNYYGDHDDDDSDDDDSYSLRGNLWVRGDN